MMRKPRGLYEGARVALLSTSGRVAGERLEPAIRSIKALGLNPILYESCTREHGYLAGNDLLRARDLNSAFADSSIAGIFCMRGGYGAHRLMPLLDFRMIAANPKVFCGYSDVTALHIVFNEICGFITYHTPMPATDNYKGLDEYTMSYYKRLLFSEKINEFTNPEGCKMKTLVSGYTQGVLVGGNLSLVVASLGTPYEINTKNKILFLEDVNEEIYQIDSKLTHLRNAGKLKDCAGIILGAFTDKTKERKNEEKNRTSLTLEEVFEEVIIPEKKPTIMDVACGHIMPTLSLPLGSLLQLDATHTRIRGEG